MTQQSTNAILMVRPSNFSFNPETQASNTFQHQNNQIDNNTLAVQEFDNLVEILRQNKIKIEIFQDEPNSQTPDSIFPNNWFSTFGGKLILYPMFAPNRRLERKRPILDFLSNKYSSATEFSKQSLDLTDFEQCNQFLEGTGSMVLDHQNRVIFMSLSQRSNLELAQELATKMGYLLVDFETQSNGSSIYHTNVMMSVGSQWMVICEEVVTTNQHKIHQNYHNKEIIKITSEQMNNFCANILELSSGSGEKLIVMSSRAYEAFTFEQINILQKYAKIVHSQLKTIENIGGGGVRCLMAELF